MATLRARPENGRLLLDFYYRGVRCREQTEFFDIPAQRRRAEHLQRHLEEALARGDFRYSDFFPGSRRAERFNEEPAEASTPLFRDFVVTWIAEMTPQWSGIHLRTVREIVKKNLLPRFGNCPVGSVTRSDVLAFRADLASLPGRKGSLGPSRINKILCFLRQILHEAASRFGFAPAFQGLKPLKIKRSDAKPFTLDEVGRILDAVRPDYRNYLIVRFFTGLRSGEINGLQWRHVDQDLGLILVRETLVTGVLEEGTKTERSARDVPMLPIVRRAIEAQWAGHDPACPWVFPTRNGLPINTKNFGSSAESVGDSCAIRLIPPHSRTGTAFCRCRRTHVAGLR